MLRDDDLAAAIETEWREADLDPRRRAMLAYAEKLTVEPAAMTTADADDLREAGFSDRDILDICEVTAYYAYVNRIADGLGVALESWLPPD